jgi:hypothetical protein
MMAFVDQHSDRLGVESICRVLRIAPSGYRKHAAQQRNPAHRQDTGITRLYVLRTEEG